MWDRTYNGLSLLIVNYFKLLCGLRGLSDTYEVLQEAEKPGKGQTYAVMLKGRETYSMMQKVFNEANGG